MRLLVLALKESLSEQDQSLFVEESLDVPLMLLRHAKCAEILLRDEKFATLHERVPGQGRVDR